MSVSLTFNCDGCGKAAAGVSHSVYSPPPVGWLWASQQGPHACGERCWWHVETAHKGRTGQGLEAISHDSVSVEGEEPDAPAPEIAPVTAIVKAQPQPVQQPRRVLEPEVLEAEAKAKPKATAKPRHTPAKVVPLTAPDACVQCGGEMPPRGRGRFPRTKCYECQPKRERAS